MLTVAPMGSSKRSQNKQLVIKGLPTLTRVIAFATLAAAGNIIVCAQQPVVPTAAAEAPPKPVAASCKEQADAFVYPPPKNAKEAKERAKEEKQREKEDHKPGWEKALGPPEQPDYKRVEEQKFWDRKFDECLDSAPLPPGFPKISSPDRREWVREVGGGRRWVVLDPASSRKFLSLKPVAAENGKSSDGLFKCETPGHQTLFFYWDKNGSRGREVVPVQGQSNSFLDKNGKFMVSMGADGTVSVVSASAPNPAPSRSAESGTDAAARSETPAPSAQPAANSPAQPYQGARSGTFECTGAPVPQNAEYVFRDVPLVKLRLDYDKKVWEGKLVPGDGQTQMLVLKNVGNGPRNRCVVHWIVIEP